MADETMYNQSDEVASALSDNARVREADKYLVVRSSGILYGINTNSVVEILTDTSVTVIPLLPAHISGVINMRGQTVPIINFRLMLGQPPSEEHCTVILDIDGTQIGIQTDDVDQIADIEKSAILPVPYQQSNQRMVTGMYTLAGGGTVMILDCNQLLHE